MKKRYAVLVERLTKTSDYCIGPFETAEAAREYVKSFLTGTQSRVLAPFEPAAFEIPRVQE